MIRIANAFMFNNILNKKTENTLVRETNDRECRFD